MLLSKLYVSRQRPLHLPPSCTFAFATTLMSQDLTLQTQNEWKEIESQVDEASALSAAQQSELDLIRSERVRTMEKKYHPSPSTITIDLTLPPRPLLWHRIAL